jgi:molybdopterin-guanine dinucleotide biosynthesis protein A
MDVTVAILAGGRGTRIGGDKALIELAGRPLITYPLQAAQEAGLPTVIVAKKTTKLPPVTAQLLLEPDEPSHPLLGIITALEHHPAIIALPCDMPFVLPLQLVALAGMAADVATLSPGQPFPSLYRYSQMALLREAMQAGASVRSTQAQSDLAPASAASTNPASQLTINTPAGLAEAERLLSRH